MSPSSPSAHVTDWTELVQESVIVCDLTGRIAQWNSASARLYGWSAGAAVGRNIDALLGVTPVPLAGPCGAGGGWQGEVQRQSAGGDRIRVRLRRALRCDSTGVPFDMVETGIDLTSSDHDEQTLALSGFRARSMAQAASMAWWELDTTRLNAMVEALHASGVRDLRDWLDQHPGGVPAMLDAIDVVDVNDFALTLFGGAGLHPVEARRQLLRGIAACWPVDSYSFFGRCVIAATIGAPDFSGETLLQSHDGRRFASLFTASFAPADVARGRVMVAIRDISQAKDEHLALEQSVAFYRDMFQNSAVSTWHLDATRARELYSQLKAEGVTDIVGYAHAHPGFLDEVVERLRVVDVNDTTLRLFGVPERERIVGGGVAAFWLPEFRSVLLGSVEASFNNRAHFSAETPMRTLDGRRIDVLFAVAASPQLRATGQALLNIVDITERVKAQHALIDMQASFAHAARISSLGELATSIAHELNQPLAAITTHGEAALRWMNRPEPDLDETRDLMVRMIADARRASDIIGRIRSMAAPQLHVQRSLSLNALVREALLFMQPDLKKRGVDIVLALADSLPDIVGDYVHLQQVFVNLALNAAQAMAGTRDPLLGVRTWMDPDGWIRMALQDNGPGIAPEHVDRLFQSFFTTKSAGMGIGLAICRSILEAHGGSIDAANADGGGARFTIRLPGNMPQLM